MGKRIPSRPFFLRQDQPVIRVDTRKKDCVGNLRNSGRAWQRHGQPLEVPVRDSLDPDWGIAVPYGVFELTLNEAWGSGGRNCDRRRLWKGALPRVTNETGPKVTVTHCPPGASTWNKIEHRLFCRMTHNRRGQPPLTRESIVQRIGRTMSRAGPKGIAALDRRKYRQGIKAADHNLKQSCLQTAAFHGDGTYTISTHPRAAGVVTVIPGQFLSKELP